MSLSFDHTYYQSRRPDVYNAFVATGGSTGQSWNEFAAQHYDSFGRFEGSDPHASFNTSFYLSAYSDVAVSGRNPFDHFLAIGSLEDRLPYFGFPNSANGFDASAYKAANSDLASLSDAAAYQHFVVHGQFEIASGSRTGEGAPKIPLRIALEERKNDPDRLLKDALFELLRIIRNDRLNFVDRSYGGVLVSEVGEPQKFASLHLEFKCEE